MKTLHLVSVLLVIVGALNWGLVGLLNVNLVHAIFGAMGGLENVIYILVGLAGLLLLVQHWSDCKVCSAK